MKGREANGKRAYVRRNDAAYVSESSLHMCGWRTYEYGAFEHAELALRGVTGTYER